MRPRIGPGGRPRRPLLADTPQGPLRGPQEATTGPKRVSGLRQLSEEAWEPAVGQQVTSVITLPVWQERDDVAPGTGKGGGHVCAAGAPHRVIVGYY